MFGILGWILLGVALGLVARLLMRGSDPDGTLLTLLIGIDAALLGGFLSVATGVTETGEPASLVAAAAGTVAALGLKLWSVRHSRQERVD